MHTPNDEELRAIRGRLRETGAGTASIERALERLEAGTYGTCELCGDTIDAERLRAVPCAPACRHCATQV